MDYNGLRCSKIAFFCENRAFFLPLHLTNQGVLNIAEDDKQRKAGACDRC